MPKQNGLAIGIDLGTTFSCVAVCQHDKVEIIANDQGKRTTPSYVAFTNTEHLIGDPAKSQASLNPQNTVFDAKRLIGRKYEDAAIQEDMKHWPFTVVSHEEKLKVQVSHKGKQRTFYPEEISAMVLAKMKQTAEAYLGSSVSQAIITVPAYFSDAQRQATIDAGVIAGLQILFEDLLGCRRRIAYGLEARNQEAGGRNILIFDLGGGTFDVSILSVEDGIFEVKATAGDTRLGGEDFDKRLVTYLAEEFKKKHRRDLHQDKKALQRLKTAAERAKCTLSSCTSASISVDSLFQGVDFHTTLTRARFEDLCTDLFRATLKPLERALRDAKMSKGDIKDIVLVGGSTRIPKIQKLLKDFFNGKELNKGIHPDEAVAYGAAVQAAILTGNRTAKMQNMFLLDVTPLSLGINTQGGVMATIIKRNSPVPTKEDVETGNTSHLTISDTRGRLGKEEIETIVQTAEEFRANDLSQQEKIEAMNSLESCTLELKRSTPALAQERGQKSGRKETPRLLSLRKTWNESAEGCSGKESPMGADLSHADTPRPTSRPETPSVLRPDTVRICPKGPAVGIDLGTTKSCVAVCQRGRVEILANDHNSRTTPSCVAFTERERLVGEPAELQASLNPENTIYNVKRLIGRRYDDPSVQSGLKNWPYHVVEAGNGKAKVQVSHRGVERVLYPEEISAMVLYKLKQVAEASLGRPVTQAVITVPAYFSDAQRQATMDAGAMAGLHVLSLVSEPTAAAVAYGLKETHQRKGKRNILIFDLGGGTFDVSILTAQDGVFEVVATAGDSHLGGEDFDQRLANQLAQEFKNKFQEDPAESRKAMQRLKAACKKAKQTLSSNTTATISVDSLYKGIDFHTTVTRACFEDLCCDLFQATMVQVQQVLEEAGLKKSQVHEIGLGGGSTHIPMIQRLLSKFFDGQRLCKSISPEEVVAHGAAIQAAVLTGHRYQNLQNLLLLDVTPISLGLETVGGVMDVLVKRNSPIPTKESRNFSTTEDQQSSLFLQIYEGERMLTKHNRLLGTITLSGLQPAPRGVPVIVVTFQIDHNNILTVSATERSTGNKKGLTITDTRGQLDREEMERILQEEEEHRAQEKLEEEKLEALNALEASTLQLKRAAAEKSLDDRAKRRLLEICEEAARTYLLLAERGFFRNEERKKELEGVCSTILTHFSTREAQQEKPKES
ncbi:Heat shock 70 kDa protein 1A/1B, partial [Ophiophagus hannah]